ncbi:F-box domain protein [Aspergillus undulatus]|uniref:F-box domain protein n=1 Tax=Aspergillus undulatus TaxID=1810928 RepID=UPI003CCE3C3D
MTRNLLRIEDLADEVIDGIFTCLEGAEPSSNTSSPVNTLDLSASFNENLEHVYGERTEWDRLRLVCKRFCDISTPRKFDHFTLRFGREGFQKLEELLRMQLACHVKTFTYMVRDFYQNSGSWSRFLVEHPNDLPAAQKHMTRLRDQIDAIDSSRDRQVLQRAMAAFSRLRQVKLLRVHDKKDQQLLEYIRVRSLTTLALEWEPACTRAVTNLGFALLASHRTSVDFVAEQIDPAAMVRLQQVPSTTLSALGARLTCIDVAFHGSRDPASYMEDASHAFYNFFSAATNLTTIHLGFPEHAPLDLSLEQVFHRIQWNKLRTFSIKYWRLTSEEIIAFVRRHRRQLRDIRLVNIYLREGSRWLDVLSVLHDEMDEIERIDLREINYASQPDTGHGHGSSSGYSVSYVTGYSNDNGNGNGNGSARLHHPPFPMSIYVDHNAPSNSPSPPLGYRAVLNTDHLPFVPQGHTRHSILSSALEVLRNRSVNDLHDDGVYVTQQQRQIWEAWVLSSPRKVARRWT